MNNIKTLNGLPASRFAFAPMQFGGTADEAAAKQMFEASRVAGINHFDTAYIYIDGHSETILGQLAKQVRDEILIATKVAYDGIGDPLKLQADFDQSRQRLDQESVDILYLHRHVGRDLERAIAWMAEQQSKGALRYIGLSNFAHGKSWTLLHLRVRTARASILSTQCTTL